MSILRKSAGIVSNCNLHLFTPCLPLLLLKGFEILTDDFKNKVSTYFEKIISPKFFSLFEK
jgi:hypothetical protein